MHLILPTAVEYEALRLNCQEFWKKKWVDFHYVVSLYKFISFLWSLSIKNVLVVLSDLFLCAVSDNKLKGWVFIHRIRIAVWFKGLTAIYHLQYLICILTGNFS